MPDEENGATNLSTGVGLVAASRFDVRKDGGLVKGLHAPIVDSAKGKHRRRGIVCDEAVESLLSEGGDDLLEDTVIASSDSGVVGPLNGQGIPRIVALVLLAIAPARRWCGERRRGWRSRRRRGDVAGDPTPRLEPKPDGVNKPAKDDANSDGGRGGGCPGKGDDAAESV